jgi:peptide/nickel transport system substrate-binding protein/oligopeptide transport system substrate-binding protein
MRRSILSIRAATLVGALFLAICAVLLAACGAPHPCEAGYCAARQFVRLQAASVTDVKTMDPPNATDVYSVDYTSIVFPGLVVLDKNLNAIPWASSALPTVSSDGLIWTFTVRPDLKWSDGTPITAETYAYSMNRAENPCNAFGAAYYLYAIKDAAAFNGERCDTTGKITGPIQTLLGDSITTTSSLTLHITLTQPATAFLAAMTYPTSYAVPEQLINQYGAKWTDHLADNGGFGGDLFMVKKWNHVGDLILARNDAFWGAKPTIQEVDVKFYRYTADAYNAYLAGQADVGFAPVAQLAQAKTTHKTFHEIPVQQINYYAMNWKIAPFNDLRMRQAFALALDKQALANNSLQETVIPTNHIVPLGAPGYNPDLVGPDGANNLTGNLTLANRLAAQYAEDTHGGTATDFSKCPPVMLTLFNDSTNTENEAQAAIQMWLKAMPKYPLTYSGPPDTLLQSNTARNLQFWSLAWVQDYPDPQDWLSTNLACGSSYNAGSTCDPQADALMRAADMNPDQSTRLQEYQEAEQLLVTNVAWLPLDQATTWWETGPHLQGFTIAADGLIPRESWQTMYRT